jgi:type VI protein secretion system component VasK
MPLPDANKTQTEIILDHAWETWEAKQGKQRGAWPAWLALGVSLAGIIYAAGLLSGDVRAADNRSMENAQRISALERQNSSIEQGVAALNAKMDILMEERKQ